MLQNHQSLQIVKDYQIVLAPTLEWGDQVAQALQIGKVQIAAEYLPELIKVKIVQELIIELERQCVLDFKIEAGCKIDLESLGPLVGQIGLTIVQGFLLV